MRNKLFVNIIALIFVQLLNYFPPLIVLPYLSRVLGVEGFGVIVISISVCNIVFIFTDYGFSLSGVYKIAKIKNEKNEVASYLGGVILIKLALFLFAVLVIFISFNSIGFDVKKNDMLFWLIMIIFSQSFQFNWFFQGIERMKNITILAAVSKLIYLFLIFLFVNQKGEEIDVLVCLAISNLVSTFLSIFVLYREKFSISIPKDYRLIKNILRDGFPFFLSRASVGIYTSASTFIVGSFAGLHQAALYSSAEKLYLAGQSITSPISQALYPHIARSKKSNDLSFLMFLTIPILVLVCGICFVFSSEIIYIFYGSDFVTASDILRIFLICSVINYISVNFGYPAFSSIGRLDLVNKSVFGGAILQLSSLLILYLFDDFSAYNLAISVLCVEFCVMVIRLCFFFMIKVKNNENSH